MEFDAFGQPAMPSLVLKQKKNANSCGFKLICVDFNK